MQRPGHEPIDLSQVVEVVIYRGRIDIGEPHGLARLSFRDGTTGVIIGNRVAPFWLEMHARATAIPEA